MIKIFTFELLWGALFHRIAHEQPQLGGCPEELRLVVARCSSLLADGKARPLVRGVNTDRRRVVTRAARPRG